jgi:hypothetical protein
MPGGESAMRYGHLSVLPYRSDVRRAARAGRERAGQRLVTARVPAERVDSGWILDQRVF